MTVAAAAAAASRTAFLVGLAVSAWIGVGLAHLATGRDLGAGLQPAYAAFAVAFVCALFDPQLRGRLLDPPPGRLLWAAAGAAVLLSWFGLRNEAVGVPDDVARMRFLKQVAQWGVMVAVAWTVCAHLHDESAWRRARIALAVGLGVQVVYGSLQIAMFGSDTSWFRACEAVATSNPAILAGSDELYVGQGFRGVPRVRGTACEPLYLASYLLATTPWFIAWGMRSRRWLFFAAGAILLLVATWSRGAWLAAAAATAVGVAIALRLGLRPRPRTVLMAAGAVLAGALLVIVAAGVDVLLLPLRRLAQSGSSWDWSNLTRLYSMQTAWRAFLAEPLFGVGWGQFAFNFYVLADIEGLQSQFDWPVVNNVPLLVLAETGLLGAVAFIASGLAVFRRLVRRLVRPGAGLALSPDTLRAAAAIVSLTGIGVQMLTFSQYNLPHLWIALGMALAVLGRGEEAIAERGP